MLKSPRMLISTLFVSTLDMFSLKISITFIWLGGRQIVRTTIGLVFGNNNSKNMFSMSLGKYDLTL